MLSRALVEPSRHRLTWAVPVIKYTIMVLIYIRQYQRSNVFKIRIKVWYPSEPFAVGSRSHKISNSALDSVVAIKIYALYVWWHLDYPI